MKVVFYQYEPNKWLDTEVIQRAIDAVYNGRNAPVILTLDNQLYHFIAICAEQVERETVLKSGYVLESNMWWREPDSPVEVFEIVT